MADTESDRITRAISSNSRYGEHCVIMGVGPLAKHRMPEKRVPRKAVLAGAAAVGLASVLALGHTADSTTRRDVALAAAVIGVGGRDDPTSTRLQNKLSGDYTLGFDDTNYQAIQYPANLAFQSSIDVGIPRLAQAVGDATGRTRIVSYSEGTLVAEQVKRNLANPKPGDPPPPSPGDLDFEFIASPYLPNGGIFARFPGLAIPGLLPTFSAAQPSAYDSTYVTNEYDGFADFPAYFNPVSLINALLGMAYAHPDQYYDGIALDELVEGQTKFTTTRPNGATGRDTYILVYNPHLPLLAPVRQIASLLALTPLTEPVLAAIEPLLRIAVDMGYTDRTNANPAVPTAFSLFTPPTKFVAAAAAIPGALREGVADAVAGAQPKSGAPAAKGDTPSVSSESSTGEQKHVIPTRSTASEDPIGQEASPTDPLTEPTRKARARVTHPTLVADGNPTRPGVSAANSAAANSDTSDTTTEVATTQSNPVPSGPSTTADTADTTQPAAA
jgi:PE-PPE domain-containing protein